MKSKFKISDQKKKIVIYDETIFFNLKKSKKVKKVDDRIVD